jgi:hypothetical protein
MILNILKKGIYSKKKCIMNELQWLLHTKL